MPNEGYTHRAGRGLAASIVVLAMLVAALSLWPAIPQPAI
jgi:hypothetical protein